MEIYQLKVFLEVARHLSFTEAADALNLTQPAVSAKIKSLEASLGAELFHRLGRKIKLTTIGNYLLDFGPSLIDLEGRLVKEIEEIKQRGFNRLKIGCTHNIASGWLPEILFAYHQKYPDIDVQCVPFVTGRSLHQAVIAGEVDVGFSETNSAEFDEIEAVPVDSFQYCLMVAADYRLADREWLSLRDLMAEAWVFPAASTPERLALESRLSELNLQPSDFKHYETVQSPSLMSTFLSQGHYLGFASSFQFQAERKANLLRAISLQEFPLDLKLFMLRPKCQVKGEAVKRELGRQRDRPSEKSEPTNPLQQLIQLVFERTRYPSEKALSPIALQNSRSIAQPPIPQQPVYLQALERAAPRGDRSTDEPKTLTITIGTQNKTIQTVTAGLIIQRLGLLEHFLPRDRRYRDTDYQIQWRDFTSGAPIVAGLQSAQLDIGVLGDYPLLLSGLSGGGMSSEEARSPLAKTRLVSFVASNPDGAGNTVIVPNRSALTTLDDLRSRVIAVPFASAAHGMIMRSLARADILPEVTLTSIDNLSIHRLTPRNSQADGYAYFAPLHDIASHKGQFRRLLEHDQEQLPTFHGIVVTQALADAHPEIVVAYLKALIAAQYWYETTPSALSLVSNWVNLDPEIVAKTLAYERADATGLFFPETQIRTDWLEAHIQQLSTISGNEALGDLDLDAWIQPELLETALSAL
ncbi:MAG: LysR substrate-binding domain-containing protein [Phormidesmis sp.]